MKKVILITMLICSIAVAKAQTLELQIENINGNVTVCLNQANRVELYGLDGCDPGQFYWLIDGQYVFDNPVILVHGNEPYFEIGYSGCDFIVPIFALEFVEPRIPSSFTQMIWKRQNEIEVIQPIGSDSLNWFTYQWSNGETTSSIEVVEAGVYTCTIFDKQGCVSATRTFIVQDNVEIESASVDPDSNKNLVTWETTPEQAEYISQVTIARDGVDMATVPYNDGQFLDNIGSDLAARIYTITGVCTDGTLCPIPSLERGTIHMAFLPDINGNVEMTWNAPHLGGAPIHVGRYEICEYDPSTMEIAVIDFVSPSVTNYSCSQSMFSYGYPLIRAIIQDGRGEKHILSNRTEDPVGQPQEITITLMPGWTWISYPYAVAMDIVTALGDFVPMEGDVIKSQYGMTEYHNGQWTGSLQQFTPGFGIMYYSARSVPATLVFGTSTSKSTRKTVVE